MYGHSFARAVRFCSLFGIPMLFLWAMAALAAVSLLMLLVVLGCVAHLLITGGSSPPLDPLLAGMMGWIAGDSPLGMLLGAAAVCGGLFLLADRQMRIAARHNALWVAARLRHDVHRHTLELGGADVLGRSHDHPVQLFTQEVARLQDGLTVWWTLMPGQLLSVIACTALAVSLHPWLGVSALLMTLLVAMLGAWLIESAALRQAVLAERTQLQMSALVEGLRHARLVIGYQLDDTPGAPFAESMPRYLKQMRALLAQRDAWRLPLALAVLVAGLLMLGLLGVNRLHQPASIGAAEATVLCAAVAVAAIRARSIVPGKRTIDAADESAAAVFSYLQREPRFKEFSDAKTTAPLVQEMRLEEVDLRDAAGHVLLENVSLTVPAKGRVALVSSDRSAALALTCLLPRFYDPDAGRVLFDGQDVRSLSIKSLRGQVALVPQDGLLFTASVQDNIACGDFRFGEQEVRAAIKRIGADEMIDRLPQGLNTIIGEHGIRLSPAESLLVGLSRAVLRDPSLLIVEEPDDLIDPRDAALVNQALTAAAEDRTLISIATRLETLRSADQVCVLVDAAGIAGSGRLSSSGDPGSGKNNGSMNSSRMLAQGTHAELLQSSEFYRHLIYLRFNEFRQRAATPVESAKLKVQG